ncbi:MAG: PEGA domain-containing protein [bacterium]|nr:PEGA domain-containing protein [bacterium]
MVIPFSIAIGLAYYFLIVAQREEPSGFVRVISEPTGALIFLDGASTQYHTDTVIPAVKQGNRKVMLDPAHWRTDPIYYSVEVKPNDTTTVKFVATRIETTDLKQISEDTNSFKPEMSQIVPNSRTPSNPMTSRTPRTMQTMQRVGAIQVVASKPGAEIFLNGLSTGKETPTTLEQLDPGSYEVSLKKAGFRSLPEKLMVTVDPDVGLAAAYFELVSENSEVEIQTLTIQTNPTGQSVSINGKRYGPTPISVQLPLGRYRIELIAATGYETPPPRDITLTKREATVLQIAYPKISGDAYLGIVVPKGSEPIDIGKLRIEVNNRPFFTGSSMETSSALWKRFPEGEKTVTIVYDNLSTDITSDFASGYVTPLELRFERLFSQIKPRVRVLDKVPYEQYRTRAGKIAVFD